MGSQCFYESFGRQRNPLHKHAYSNILKISPPRTENFQVKNFDIFHISAQNIDYGYSLEPPRRCGSNEYPQSMVLSRNKKNNAYPCKLQFYCIKMGLKGVKIKQACFVMSDLTLLMRRLICVFIRRTCVLVFQLSFELKLY